MQRWNKTFFFTNSKVIHTHTPPSTILSSSLLLSFFSKPPLLITFFRQFCLNEIQDAHKNKQTKENYFFKL